MENTKLLPLGTEQGLEETEYPSFDLCLGENMVSPLVAQHRQWLKTIRHEVPNPKIPFKVAVYIRFFNQTKYRDEEYLERNKEVFRATLAQYPMWEFVGFYIDNGSTAPYMENSTAWSELLSDCDAGKVDLIITQKVSNVSRDAQEMAICARMLAATSLLLASTSYQKIYTLWPHIIVMTFGNPVSSQHQTGKSCLMTSWI